MAAALRARRRRPDSDITVIERSSRISIANCSIPDFLGGGIEDVAALQLLTPSDAETRHHLQIFTNHKALKIEPVRRRLLIENLKTRQQFDLPYDTLILSTGADPVRPRWQNHKARGIFTLRNLDDAENLRRFIERRKPDKFVIIGTGAIAQECASSLARYPMKIQMIGLPGGLMTDIETSLSQAIEETLKLHNIYVYYTDNLSGFKVSLNNEVSGVIDGNRVIPCQGVLLGMGVTPNVDLAASAGIALGRTGAIRVNRRLLTSRSRVYACGDCAETFNRITKKPVFWPLATTAARQGRQAGENASGGNGYDPGTYLTRLWTCFDLQIGRTGLSSSQAEAIGIKAHITEVTAPSKSPLAGGRDLRLFIISDAANGRIIGSQVVGSEGVAARLNMLVTAISGKMTLRDLEHLDLGYMPNLTPLWDPVQIAGRLGGKEL